MHSNQPVKLARLVAALMVGAVALTACGGTTGAQGQGDGTPHPGGEIVVGGLMTSALDPGQIGYSMQSQAYTRPVLGALFFPPTEKGGEVRPDLATGYTYSADKLTMTITLRAGAKFQDDTPVDAEAVAWNLTRAAKPGGTSGQYFSQVGDIAASGKDKVVIKFKEPYALLPDAFAFTPAGYLASPTAFKSMGADKFAKQPVGAGPFKVVSVQPGQELVVEKAPTYWDAAHVYLEKITWLNTGANAQASYVKLQSNAIQSISYSGANTSPSVLTQAEHNDALTTGKTASTTYQILPINTFKAPFNDPRARQAIAYCTDREGIAKNVTQNYATPAYVLSGPDSDFLSGWQDGKTLNPYLYDVNKGKQLVGQLGGLEFKLVTNVTSTVVTALQQQWAECGIKADIDITDQYLTEVEDGNYQMSYTTAANRSYNPGLITTYQDPTTAMGAHGFRDDGITSKINTAKGVSDPAKAKATWREIWKSVNNLGVSPSVLSAPYYVFSSKCLHGVTTDDNVGGSYDHAYLSC